MTDHELGNKIRVGRENKKLTQFELAKMLGYKTPQFISLFERGLSKVPANKLKQICQICGLNLEKVTRGLVQQFEIELRGEIENM
jgi:transcriptional regulator with XRE-family HTH domain